MSVSSNHKRQTDMVDHDNLDPFLDIISNVVGILIVVAVLIAVSISAATTTVYAPLLYSPPKTIKWEDEVFCVNGRILFTDGQLIESQLHQFAKTQFGSNWQCDENGLRKAWKLWRENKQSFRTENFRVGDFFWNEDTQYASISLEALPDSGDDLKKLKTSESWFRAFLASKNPAKEGITLIAAPSGFREFQAARDLAKSAGFHVEVRIFKSDAIYWPLYDPSNSAVKTGLDVQ